MSFPQDLSSTIRVLQEIENNLPADPSFIAFLTIQRLQIKSIRAQIEQVLAEVKHIKHLDIRQVPALNEETLNPTRESMMNMYGFQEGEQPIGEFTNSLDAVGPAAFQDFMVTRAKLLAYKKNAGDRAITPPGMDVEVVAESLAMSGLGEAPKKSVKGKDEEDKDGEVKEDKKGGLTVSESAAMLVENEAVHIYEHVGHLKKDEDEVEG